METYIALLRGINVSGQKMIRMEELKRVLGELDMKRITTFIQSGNILFESRKNDPAGLAADIGGKILEHFGFVVPVVIRTINELREISQNNPFLPDVHKDTEKMHVTFLSGKPDKVLENKIKEFQFLPEEFVLNQKEVYLYCPEGYGRTKLNNQFFENKLKVTATTRNWKTVGTLVTLGMSDR